MEKTLDKLDARSKKDSRALVKQLLKFGIVGTFSTAISLGIYYLAVYINKRWYLAGNVVGYIVSVVFSYFVNRCVVFKSSEAGSRPAMRYIAVYGITFVISNLLLYMLVDLLAVSEMLAPILNMAVTVPINFLLCKFWAFKAYTARNLTELDGTLFTV